MRQTFDMAFSHKPTTASSLHRNTGTSRRAFCAGTATLFFGWGGLLRGLGPSGQNGPQVTIATSRPDVAAIDHDRILAAARRYLTERPKPLTTMRCSRSPGTPHDYYSEVESQPELVSSPDSPAATKDGAPPPPFTEHRDALFALGLQVPALVAANVLTG